MSVEVRVAGLGQSTTEVTSAAAAAKEAGEAFVAALLREEEAGSITASFESLDAASSELEEADDRISAFQEDVLVKEAFTKGTDLREYAKQIANELDAVEQEHVLGCMMGSQSSFLVHMTEQIFLDVKQCQPFVDLHRQIQACDEILQRMESLMHGFQSDLGNISAEIQILQDQSQSMNVRLKNRTSMQTILNSVLDGVLVSPDLIRKISEGEVNEFFLQHLADLNKKMAYVKSQQGQHIRAFKDVGPELERLRLRAAEKSKEFLIKRIESLRAPNTNIAIIQQNIFLKYKELFWFLAERYSDVAMEVHNLYVNTVGNYFLVSFEKYMKSLQKLQTVIADKSDLIASEESGKRGLPGLPGIFGAKQALKDKTNVFSLGERLNVTTTADPGIILTHIAEEKNIKFPFEAIYKSLSRLLMDNASSEYLFDTDFFSPPRGKNAKLTKDGNAGALTFSEVFEPTLRLIQAFNKTTIDASFDGVGILLCIRLNMLNLRIMQARRIPCLESFMNATNMLLWPRFQAIMDMHIDSLKKASPRSLLPSKDVHPHYITRRYAEFSASILTLNQGYDDALLINSLFRLRTEVEHLLMRMSGEFPDPKQKLVFLINNLDLVVSILSEHSTSSFEQEKSHFTTLLESKTNEYVDEELKPYFANLMRFVSTAESGLDLASLQEENFERIAAEFNQNWKGALGNINQSVMQSFANFQNGARILHHALTQLVLYYKRFMSLWDKRFLNRKPKVQPIGLQSVMVEIKKFRSSFQ
ncbi:Sac2 family-domain-containing protein [Fimicolochytrium jonesii]|uniref:Sac2 family-domain-containing protein n=1 Tax=Fimicolochytrium jonesii TaxID=1396493 RepID=UPI0022FE6CA3|nr:Sac2 family-domain-containing protein [Fimicolochytrium jonesii]KAI8822052.1 Sac2 family-domain-containing protein [Fimicolochytrium jonesii]